MTATACPYTRDDLRAAWEEGARHFAMPPLAPLRGCIDPMRPKAQRDAFSRGWKAAREQRDAVRARDRRYFAAIVDDRNTADGITVEIFTSGDQPMRDAGARAECERIARNLGRHYTVQTFTATYNPHSEGSA